MSGYARFHRSLIGHPAFRNDAEAMAFAYMVLRAQWKATRVRYKGRVISLDRGQLTMSQRDMAQALDRDKAWIERLWKRLRDEGMIAVKYEAGVEAGVEAPVKAKREAGASVITICNYDKYQHSNDDREAPREAPKKADARQAQGTEQVREEGNKELELSPNGDCASDDALKPEHIAEAWNELAPRIGKPTIRTLTPERRQRVKARIAGYSLDDWRSVLGAVERSPFLRGDTGWHGCTFDWLTKKANFQKTLEGNYDDKPTQAAAQSRY